MHGIPSEFLGETAAALERYRDLAEGAISQLSDEEIARSLGEEDNSIAVIMKHLGGNMRSRWRDFLSTDGEKPDRDRDSEFEVGPDVSRDEVMRWWNEGWEEAFSALDRLRPTDLDGTVMLYGKPLSVVQALMRQVGHVAYHVGQIVLLAKHHRGASWETLSIPRRR